MSVIYEELSLEWLFGKWRTIAMSSKCISVNRMKYIIAVQTTKVLYFWIFIISVLAKKTLAKTEWELLAWLNNWGHQSVNYIIWINVCIHKRSVGFIGSYFLCEMCGHKAEDYALVAASGTIPYLAPSATLTTVIFYLPYKLLFITHILSCYNN